MSASVHFTVCYLAGGVKIFGLTDTVNMQDQTQAQSACGELLMYKFEAVL